MADPLDLPALRAVIAGVRERLDEFSAACQEVGSHRTPEAIGRAKGVREAVESDLTTLADACERLVEENERLRGDLRDAHSVLVMARAFHAYSGGPLSGPFPSVVERRLSVYRTPAPAGKAGDMSTGLTIDSSAPAGKGEG